MTCHHNKEQRLGRSLCPGTATGIGSGNYEAADVIFAGFGKLRQEEKPEHLTGVPGRSILLRQDLLTLCHPLSAKHMAIVSLPFTSQ